MNFEQYESFFLQKAKEHGITDEQIVKLLQYAKKINENGLPIIFDQLHFSYLVGYDYKFILSISNSTNLFYKNYTIPKRNGKLREISEPFPSLKEIQEWTLKFILNSSLKKFVSPVAKAYIPKVSIRDNARFHRGQKVVLNIDLVDFFGSITFEQIYAVFRNFGYNKSVSTLITNLCLLNGSLPQGSPTSPLLSNLVFRYYDEKIFQFCKERAIRYTRYADDLTFSGDFKVQDVLIFIKKVFIKTKFRINNSKTKVLSQGASQRVTGIVVNNKIQLPIHYRKEIRKEVYFVVKYGLAQHLSTINWKKTPEDYLYHLLGKINFVLMINKNDTNAFKYYLFIVKLLKEIKM